MGDLEKPKLLDKKSWIASKSEKKWIKTATFLTNWF